MAEQKTTTNPADIFNDAAERARQFHETLLENVRSFQAPAELEEAGKNAVGRYVEWLDNVAAEQRKFAETPEVQQIGGIATVLQTQADFMGEFAKSLRNFTAGTAEADKAETGTAKAGTAKAGAAKADAAKK